MQTSLIGRTIAEDPHEGSTIVAVWAGGEHRSAHWLVEDRSGKCWEIAAAGWALEPERGTPPSTMILSTRSSLLRGGNQASHQGHTQRSGRKIVTVNSRASSLPGRVRSLFSAGTHNTVNFGVITCY